MSSSPTAEHGLHDEIVIVGAKENNLKNISLRLPKRQFIVFTGVSGSGKSSLVFSTLAAESQRLINETYTSFVQGFMPTLPRPHVDILQGLTTAIVVNQEPLGTNPRSTVGTATDATSMLRVLFSRLAVPHAGGPGAYSFNVPSVEAAGAIEVKKGTKTTKKRASFSRTGGMCPECEGTGRTSKFAISAFINEELSLNDGALDIPGFKTGGWSYRMYAESNLFPADKPIKDFTTQQREDFLYKEPTKMKIAGINMTYEGLLPRLQKSMLTKDREAMQPHICEFVDRAITFVTCPSCQGTRLAPHALESRINNKNIAELCAMEISDLTIWLEKLNHPEVQLLIDALIATLKNFEAVGLGYLTLDRPAATLSGGEAQRSKMVRHLGSALTDVSYVFDEPTAGLHPHDITRMNDLLRRLADASNTVLVVEHQPATIEAADYIVDMGPGAGKAGGEIIFAGTPKQLAQTDTLTAEHLKHKAIINHTPRTGTGFIEIVNAQRNTLKNVSVSIPTGVLTAITGVAGSGKSSLIHEIPKDETTVLIDQSVIRGSRRSNPATYTGILTAIRSAFAKASGEKPALFSPNSEGACQHCKGSGVTYVDMGFIQGPAAVCEICEGRRFEEHVLQHLFGGKTIADVLAMPANQAAEFFARSESKVPAAQKTSQRMTDVGIGYLTLGQPLSELSGGERQRLKLATHMAEKATTFILDEPTRGLHLADVAKLNKVFDQLVEEGKTVIVVEHNLSVIAHADHIIDMGPGAGSQGGTVVFEGSPEKLLTSDTLTGHYLAQAATT
ncbi:ATP-binding cassette domain-containing protein [Corynebacterium kutscheri]|uniref:UvrABC system protein A n=1 Tax=Corynebacterium kutscheri TaxID=35755 RepID=A0AB38VUB8_9CORY|nr:excinuclease ABC subunit UvrA [Corynebacterium kutscheri]VEH08952.1 excinuclease ATPase subunit-UvrA-like protein [Corynebacterium kutscheri]